MSMNLTKNVKVTRVMNAVAAGSDDQTGSSVDMQDFDSVTFVLSVGTLTATQVTSMRAQQSSDDGSADSFTDLTGSATDAMADDDDNQLVVLEVYKPLERYIRPVVDRATANAVIDGIIAIQSGPAKAPTTNDTTTVQTTNLVISPSEGTA